MESLDSFGKDLSVRRFTQASVSVMMSDTNKFGSGEVDLPVTDEEVHRHLSYLALRLNFPVLTDSDLWTLDFPIGIETETTDGLAGYRYHLNRTSRNQTGVSEHHDIKKRKLQLTINDSESDDEDLRTWIANLEEEVPDMQPSEQQAYRNLTVPGTPPQEEPTQPGVPDYLRIMVHFLTKMNTAMDAMTAELV